MIVTSQDLLNISLSIGFIILVVFLCWVCFYLVGILKSIKVLIANIEDITKDARFVKNQLKSGVLAGLGTFLNLLTVFMKKKKQRR